VGYREEIFRHEPAAKTGSRKRVKLGGKKKEEIEFTEKRLLYQIFTFLGDQFYDSSIPSPFFSAFRISSSGDDDGFSGSIPIGESGSFSGSRSARTSFSKVSSE
jgi:hypothetical protein